MGRTTAILAALACSSMWVLAACGSSSTSGTTPTAAPATASPSAAATTTPAATTSDSDAYPIVAQYAGKYTGSWNDTTFGTTGTMTWDIFPDPAKRTVTIDVNVGGKFFGGGGAPPESIVLTHLAQGVVSGNSKAFGVVTGTISPTGSVHMTLTNIPGGSIKSVEVTGTLSGGTTISMQYTVTFTGSSSTAVGTVTLHKG